MNTSKKIALMALAALVGAACADKPQGNLTDVTLPVAAVDVMEGVSGLMDGANDAGSGNLLFLSPVVTPNPTPPGPLATGVAPLVEICNKDFLEQDFNPAASCSTNTAVEEDDHYHFGLKSGIEEKPKDGSPYRVRVFDSNGLLLGQFVVDLTTNRNIPIKFWLGDGFLEDPEQQKCVDDDRCDLGTVVSDNGGTVQVTAIDPDGGASDTIAAAIFPPNWSPGGIDRTVIIDCRNGDPSGFASDMSGPLNTDLTQLPWYCDFSVDPPLEMGQTFNQPVTVEVCEVLELDHGGVVLGKSSGEEDFELLPFVEPTRLGDCFVDYEQDGIPQVGANGLWNGMTRRLASIFRAVGPRPLLAKMRRDGGAGGVAISFSAINPVIPAAIEVTVEGDEGGLDVTLNLGETEVDAGQTDGSGMVHFEGLLVGEYSVTVSGSEVEYEGGSTQFVDVFASRPFPDDPDSPPFQVFFEPLDEQGDVPTILSAVPTSGAAGQMITLFVENIDFVQEGDITPNVAVTFSNGEFAQDGFVLESPSTDTELYVRIPSGYPAGSVGVTLTNNQSETTGPAFPYTLGNAPGTPVILDVTPSSVLIGNSLQIQTYGVDTVGGDGCFTQQETAPVSGPTCDGDVVDATSSSSTDGNLSIIIPTPNSLSDGPAWVQVRQGAGGGGFSTADSDWSVPVQINIVVPGD